MDNILDFQENDNFLNAIEFKENLKIFIRTWDELLYQIEFEECGKLELDYGGIEFEIGAIRPPLTLIPNGRSHLFQKIKTIANIMN